MSEPTQPRPARTERPGDAPADDDFWDDEWQDGSWSEAPERNGRQDLLIALGVIGAIVVVALILLSTTHRPASGPDADRHGAAHHQDKGGFCDDWPSVLGGDGSNVTQAPGVYLWSDFHGIHVRSNGPDPIAVKVTGNSPFTVTHRGAGVTASAASGSVVSFVLPAGPGTAGPDLNVPCSTTGLRFEVLKDDLPVPVDAIHVGGSGTATANPSSFLRTPA